MKNLHLIINECEKNYLKQNKLFWEEFIYRVYNGRLPQYSVVSVFFLSDSSHYFYSLCTNSRQEFSSAARARDSTHQQQCLPPSSYLLLWHLSSILPMEWRSCSIKGTLNFCCSNTQIHFYLYFIFHLWEYRGVPPVTCVMWYLCETSVSVLFPPQCSKSCGVGHRQRALRCVDHNQQEVHEMYCVKQIRPPHIESCHTQACEFIWITGDWTEVRAKDGVCHLPDFVVPLKALRSLSSNVKFDSSKGLLM